MNERFTDKQIRIFRYFLRRKSIDKLFTNKKEWNLLFGKNRKIDELERISFSEEGSEVSKLFSYDQ